MPWPNTLLIGAMKSGTSSVYEYLRQHPQIYMSPIKEPEFFAFETAPNFVGFKDDRIPYVIDATAYRALFDGVNREIAIGEASTIYLYWPTAAERIRRLAPDAKLIAILRHPVDRAYSNFVQLVRHRHESLMDFGAALREEESRVARRWGPRWHYKRRGLYGEQLQRYFDRFAPERLRVYLYEDLNRDAIAVLQDIFRFIGVDDSFKPDVSMRFNVSGVPMSPGLDRWLRSRTSRVKAIVRPLLPLALRRRAINSAMNSNLRSAPPLTPAVRAELTEFFRADILRLQDLIGRDLSHWLR
ncbi:MAG TPA: sulfotransferase [Candidatus Kryptonia bacterium]|nr:sulfotransferase [Candidatus Kryptonia bacterium]